MICLRKMRFRLKNGSLALSLCFSKNEMKLKIKFLELISAVPKCFHGCILFRIPIFHIFRRKMGTQQIEKDEVLSVRGKNQLYFKETVKGTK